MDAVRGEKPATPVSVGGVSSASSQMGVAMIDERLPVASESDGPGVRLIRVILICAFLVAAVTVVIAATLAAFYRGNDVSGGGVDSSQRPLIFWMLAVGGLYGWVMGTSVLLGWARGLASVPHLTRPLAAFFLGPVLRSDDSVVALARRLRPRMRTYLALRLLVCGALVQLMYFLPPFLLASLVHPGYYWASELPAIVGMGVAAAAWTARLVLIEVKGARVDRGS